PIVLGAAPMIYVAVKAALSGIIIAIVSEVARRSPTLGALIVSLPLVSVLGILWLWRDTGDVERIAAHAQSTFWYVLPTLPMFLLMPAMLRHGIGFWLTLATCCAVTFILYLGMIRAREEFMGTVHQLRWDRPRGRPSPRTPRKFLARRSDALLFFGVLIVAAAIGAKALGLWHEPDSVLPMGSVQVIDGDSLKIGGEKITLIAINAPQFHQTCLDPQGSAVHCA